MFRLHYLGWLALAGVGLTAPLVHAQAVRSDHVEVELVAENQSVAPNGENGLGLRIKPDDGWHVYWRNPGDAGLATRVDWHLPEGVTAGEFQWPYPEIVPLAGIVSYGYSGETLLPFALQIAETPPPADPLKIAGTAHWLVCKDVCIPGSADVSLLLPVARGTPPSAEPQWRALFTKARAALPQPAPADWKVVFQTKAPDFSLGIQNARFSSGTQFYPYANTLLNHSAPQRVLNDGEHGLRISQKLNDAFDQPPDEVEGVLVVQGGDAVKAWELHAQPGAVTPVPESAVKAATAPVDVPAASTVSLGGALLLALLGGLVLNLMPCVFPVLSIKAISVIEARGKVARRQRGQALAYAAGVMLTFAALAAALLALRGGGHAVGWGFQLQQPVFVAGLADLFFAMGLSLSGVAHFGTRIMGVGQSLTSDGGYRGSFFTGVLAVAVASPCTAPFMGVALGYALAQPPVAALAVFLALGFGLALPFLLIGYIPALARLLPRPGRWMETFKQAMAFPLYVTVVWLLWVLGGLTDRNGMTAGLLSLTLIAFALWLWNRSGWMAGLLKVAAVIGGLALLATPPIRGAPQGASSAAAIAGSTHEAWSEARVAELRGQGRTVFVNFTADWCITCKVNERVALAADATRKAFTEDQVIWLEGDWTRSDPAITQVLTRFGRSGVPLYLVYPKGGEPKVLPQVLTPSIVIGALKPSA